MSDTHTFNYTYKILFGKNRIYLLFTVLYFLYNFLILIEKEVFMARKGKVIIDRELCKGCYLCIRACPVKGLEKEAELNSTGSYPVKPAENGGSCIACGNCFEVCPDVCIQIFELGA